jgi:hypothetical protein
MAAATVAAFVPAVVPRASLRPAAAKKAVAPRVSNVAKISSFQIWQPVDNKVCTPAAPSRAERSL